MQPRRAAPDQSTILIRIEDVDLVNRRVHGFDKSKSRIDASFRDFPGGGLLRIPNQGETWVAERKGFIWRLVGRLDSGDEHDAVVADLEPGDARLDAQVLHIDAESLLLNGTPFPGTELLYQELSVNKSIHSSTDHEATPFTILNMNPITVDGNTPILIEVYMPSVTVGASGADLGLSLWESTDLGRLGYWFNNVTSAQTFGGFLMRRRLTPSAGSHTYRLRAWANTANGTILAGTGGAGAYSPLSVRITAA